MDFLALTEHTLAQSKHCVFLRRHCYPCRYLDLIPMFGRSLHELCLINNAFLKKKQETLNRNMNMTET